MKAALIAASSALTAAAALPYIRDIVHGRARPRVASWGIWAVVQAVGTASAFGARQLPAACYTLFCAAGCAAVVLLGWRHGSRDFGPLDAVCADAAMVAMIFVSPHNRDRRPAASRPRGFPLEPMMRLSVASAQWRPVTGRDWRQT